MIQKQFKNLLLQNRPFTVEEVATLLGKTTKDTSVALSRYAKQGHLKRIKKGIYLPVSQRFLNPEESNSDAWSLVPTLFPDAYVGGWTAANFWGLTEQIFQTTCVLTPHPVFKNAHTISDFTYMVFQIKPSYLFGTDITWRENIPVTLSDPHKTIIDMIKNPRCGGGIQHVIDCFKTYVHEQYEESIMIDYSNQVREGAFFKRLGFLAEKILGKNHPLCILSQQKMTKGYNAIDFDLPCTTLITRWNLFINPEIIL